jgi:hypothetical protein
MVGLNGADDLDSSDEEQGVRCEQDEDFHKASFVAIGRQPFDAAEPESAPCHIVIQG